MEADQIRHYRYHIIPSPRLLMNNTHFSLPAQLLKVMDLESSPLADAFGSYNAATLTTVIDEDDEGIEIRRHFAFTDGSHEDQRTSKKFNVESDFDVSRDSLLGNLSVKGFHYQNYHSVF